MKTMNNQFVITIDSKVSSDFAINFLKNVNFIKSVKPKKDKREPAVDEVTLLSEKALAEDWFSEEDDQWDKVL